MRQRVLITDSTIGDATIERALCVPAGYALIQDQCRSEDDVIRAIGEWQPVGILVQRAPITRRVLAACHGVRVIVRYGVGLDNVDVHAAEEFGVRVLATPGYGSNEVADHAMTLTLSLLRGLSNWSRGAAMGEWPRRGRLPDPVELDHATLGLLGFGAIARRVAVRARSFDMRVIAHDPYVETPFPDRGVDGVNWDELWHRSTVISIHTPLTDATRGVVDRSVLGAPGGPSFIVNTARADIIDRASLEEALQGDGLLGAGLDVWWEEPPLASDALIRHPKVLLTPHVAWLSTGSVSRLQTMAVTALLEGLGQGVRAT